MEALARIVNFTRETLARLRDKRIGPRFEVGLAFPLKAWLSLPGGDPTLPAEARQPTTWPGCVANLSRYGAGLLLPPLASATRGAPAQLTLTLDDQRWLLPCVVAHCRLHNAFAHCGVWLQLAEGPTEAAYLELVEAVRTGATFARAKALPFARQSPDLVLEHYRAANQARLVVWRETGTQRPDSFELVLGPHRFRGGASGADLEIQSQESAGGPRRTGSSASPLAPLGAGTPLRLFRWVVPNLSPKVPADVRGLLERHLR